MKGFRSAAGVLLISGAIFAGCGGSGSSQAKTPKGASTVANSAVQTDSNGNTVSTSAAPPTAAPSTTPPAAAGDAISGKRLFQGRCQACHINGGLVSGFGPKLAGAGLDAATIQTTVRNGRGQMPAWGGGAPYSDKELGTIVAYILSIQ